MSTKDFTVGGTRISVTGSWLKTARLNDEWHHDIDDPAVFIKELSDSRLKADVFSFWQRPPKTEPQFSYYYEWDPIAVLPVSTYEHWFKKQINMQARNKVSKAEKKGVTVRKANFDDEFIRGMVAIFNESPIRQGREFWHYGKDFDTVKREFSRYLFREELFGAYFEGELIGFIFLVDAGHIAMLGQIISTIRHRDKAPNNALIAKAVEVCASRKVPFLAYAKWPAPGSLRDFKRYNGFECVQLPRYYVPLNLKGRIALKFKLHRDATDLRRQVLDWLPERVMLRLKDLRAQFLTWRNKRPGPIESSAGK
jgi:hypothetical protein